MDSNSRSTSWHDLLTNRRGRTLEEYLMSTEMHIMNEETHLTTFRNSIGTSNIDLTIINNQLLNAVGKWKKSDQDSCSEHSILRYIVGYSKAIRAKRDTLKVKYKVTKEGKEKFQTNLTSWAEHKFSDILNEASPETLDNFLRTRATTEPDIETSVEEFHEILEDACRSTFLTSRVTKRTQTHKTVPWWCPELTVMRKMLYAHRRMYQRTTGCEELRSQRRALYQEAKIIYAGKTKNAKVRSWKEYCNITRTQNSGMKFTG